ncbi:MAG: serine hydrolase domain-containing protein, partial [Ignavibacteria bacterium]|nr:serine hydrolase domain-containing protein [Ignavibacteria bacterium]
MNHKPEIAATFRGCAKNSFVTSTERRSLRNLFSYSSQISLPINLSADRQDRDRNDTLKQVMQQFLKFGAISFRSFIAIALLFFLNTCLYSQTRSIDFNDVDIVINKAIEDKAFPGAVVLIWKDGKIIYEKAFGNFTYDPKSDKVTTQTIYDLASLTKVVATTTAAMICYDRELFSLNDKVTKYIPEFGVNGKDEITIKNLLLHNSGLPEWKKFYGRNLNCDDVLSEIYNSELEYKTGEKTVYSDLGIIALGKIIESVTKKSLAGFYVDEIYNKLGMEYSFFSPPDLPGFLKELCAPTEVDNYWRMKTLQG